MGSVEIEAPAKINLRLKVLEQMTSGFHSLETVFCALELCDSLHIQRSDGEIELDVIGDVDVGPPESNLVVRAARRFLGEVGRPADGVRIELRKRIPSAAGLGGGSSDAAATLLGLNAMYGELVEKQRLAELGGELGSDVPFFLGGSALALAWGRGERLSQIPAMPSRHVLVAHPGVPMPTGQAFQRIAELRGGGFAPSAALLSFERLSDWEGMVGIAENDFDQVAFERIPGLQTARDAMLASGAEIALLAGSGSAIFGVFFAEQAMAEAERRISVLGLRRWRTATRVSLPEPIFHTLARG